MAMVPPSLLAAAIAACIASAQLIDFAPWPYSRGNAAGASNAVVPAPNNNVLVRRLSFHDLSGTPAVDANGTIYVKSHRMMFATGSDAVLKWKFAGDFSTNPTVGPDGTVYILTDDDDDDGDDDDDDVHNLLAISPQGVLKWSLPVSGDFAFEDPVVGADGIVYFGGWAIPGSNSVNSIFAVSSGGVLKWIFNLPDEYGANSAPAVGLDGTVYAGSPGMIFALNPNSPNLSGEVKWKLNWSDTDDCACCPAVGPDGTIYVLCNNLYAISPGGVLKWKFQPEDPEGGGDQQIYCPAVGTGGTVYLIDNKNLYAVSPDNKLEWKFGWPTGVQPPFYDFTQPIVGADGTVYVELGSADVELAESREVDEELALYAISPGGVLKWKTESGTSSSPAIDADGTIYIAAGGLSMMGLSAGHVTTGLHLAQRRLMRNQSATPELQRLCNFSPDVNFMPSCNPRLGCNVCDACCKDYISGSEACSMCFAETCPPRNDTFTAETVELVGVACQALNNTANSAPYRTAWSGFVEPLSFNFYKEKISDGGTLMTQLERYEFELDAFVAQGTDLEKRVEAARDAVLGYTADEGNWNDQLQRDQTACQSYGKQIVKLGQQMDAKFAAVQDDVHQLIRKLTHQMSDLQAQWTKAQDIDESRKAWSRFGSIFSVVRAVVAVGACYEAAAATAGAAALACVPENMDAIGGAVSLARSCIDTFRSHCEPCKQLKQEMDAAQHAEDELGTLVAMVTAVQALSAQLNSSMPLPNELPKFISERIMLDSLRTSVEIFQQEIVDAAGSTTDEFLADIKDWADMGVARVGLFLAYYNIAARVQTDSGSLKALHTRTSIVQGHLEDFAAKRAAIVTGAVLLRERQEKQSLLVAKYLYEEWKQFMYFSLRQLPLLEVPESPRSGDFRALQGKLEKAYEDEIKAQQTPPSMGWVHIEISAKSEPQTIAAMRSRGSATVVLPIPLKNTTDVSTNQTRLVADTLFYNVRLHDVGVYLLDASGKTLGSNTVQVTVAKSGQSFFFDKSLQLHVFSHSEVRYGSGIFVYDSTTSCPLDHVGSSCGGLCPDYIRYSPFGHWQVTVYEPAQQGIDMSKLATLRFEFEVSFLHQDGYNPNIFGKRPPTYPQKFGRLCKNDDKVHTVVV